MLLVGEEGRGEDEGEDQGISGSHCHTLKNRRLLLKG
jgi:hypothetical protein